MSYYKIFNNMQIDHNKFDKEVISRIESDYIKFHKYCLTDMEKLRSSVEITCPYCKSPDFTKHGKDKNGVERYKCKSCGKTYNNLCNSLFFSSKINIKSWYAFLECILSGSSNHVAMLTAKISRPTSSQWMKKIFKALENYQNSIRIGGKIFVDETYVHVDKKDKVVLDDTRKDSDVRKELRGISRNKICILIGTDGQKSFAEVGGRGRPMKSKNLEIGRRHILPKSVMIGDEDKSVVLLAKELDLKRRVYKSNTIEAYRELREVDELCGRLKFFLDKHRGFKKDLLQNYLNLFIFIENEKKSDENLYKTTAKLLRYLIEHQINKANK